MDETLAPVFFRFGDAHQPRLLKQLNRDHCGWALSADALRQLADRKSVFFPQLAQITPLADGDAVCGRTLVHHTLPGLCELAHVIADASLQRNEDGIRSRRNLTRDSAKIAHANLVDIY